MGWGERDAVTSSSRCVAPATSGGLLPHRVDSCPPGGLLPPRADSCPLGRTPAPRADSCVADSCPLGGLLPLGRTPAPWADSCPLGLRALCPATSGPTCCASRGPPPFSSRPLVRVSRRAPGCALPRLLEGPRRHPALERSAALASRTPAPSSSPPTSVPSTHASWRPRSRRPQWPATPATTTQPLV